MSDHLLPAGKLPGGLLDTLLNRYIVPDPSVLIGPGVGRDAAALSVGGTALVVKTDPITFATEDAGRYVVNVNANDIACMGATPRWLLATALFPENSTTAELVESSFRSLAKAAEELGVLLVGGHSEITIGLDRLILVGQMLGVCDPDDLYNLRTARAGDAVLLASGIAIEGTALLAVEARDALTMVDPGTVERAESLLSQPGISVLPAAAALRDARIQVRGLHDPTEGGLATALLELSNATGLGIEVDADRILVRPETSAICDALAVDPLGLIASGALLAVVPPDQADKSLAAWHDRSIDGAMIGSLVADPSQRIMRRGALVEAIPTFAVDEIARYFAELRTS